MGANGPPYETLYVRRSVPVPAPETVPGTESSSIVLVLVVVLVLDFDRHWLGERKAA